MDLIGPQPDLKKPVNTVDSGQSDAGVVSIRPAGSVADAQNSDLAPLLRLLDAATPETRALLIRMLGSMLQHFHAQVSPTNPLQPQASPEA
jgi:hypothetical protein